MSDTVNRLAFASTSDALAWLGECAGGASVRGRAAPEPFAVACIAVMADAEIARLRALLVADGRNPVSPEGVDPDAKHEGETACS